MDQDDIVKEFLANYQFPSGDLYIAYKARMIMKFVHQRQRESSKNKNGNACKICSMINEYAESNQDDGSYICYNCR